MRQKQKKALLQSIDTLKAAQRKLKVIPCGAGNELFAQSQELAIAIGETVERSDKNNKITVRYVEECCELLYKGFVCVDRSEYTQILKDIGKSLKQLEKSIREDIQNSPYEIVFMPYKASMWDTFDTVYRAAKEDGSCHVTVMPVPYSNLNRKDGQAELHYEGDQFPNDIPIIDYHTYSLEVACPDVIFIHNPYDQCNYVTRLPEEYYSSNLVRYTDHLVYIPYFITRGIDVKEIYCTLPAIQNAWKIFVQCEAVRKCYIKYGAKPEKVVAMGSPKFDMVINMEENPPEVPDSWKNVLHGRRVFLLNTHLNSIINEAEKMLDKLHRVFRLFERQRNAVLLWRPHPLSIETAKAMNPQMLEKYLTIVKEFKTLENGIYDDTPDVHRAIALSDAYIGDWSSMVPLYGFTGKPMYITNINVNTNIEESEKERRLAFSCAAEADGFLWVPGDEVNGLFRIHEESGESRLMASFDGEDLCGTSLYRRVIAYKRKLFFVPWRAEHIAEYDLDTEKMRYYEIYGNKEKGKEKFGGCTVKASLLYLFPVRIRDVVCLNMDTGEIRYEKPDLDEIPNKLKNSSVAEIAMFVNSINIGNIQYLPCLRTNKLIKLSMEDFYGEAVDIAGTDEGFIDAADQGKNLYLLSVNGNIFKYDLEMDHAELFWTNSSKRPDGSLPYYRILYYKNYLWLLPAYSEHICKINMKTAKEEEINEYPDGFQYIEDQQLHPFKWFNGEVKREKLRLYPYQANMMLTWSDPQNMAEGRQIRKPKDIQFENYRFSKDKDECLYYEAEYSLSYFLNTVMSGQDLYREKRKSYFRSLQYRTEGLYGDAIWQYIRSRF